MNIKSNLIIAKEIFNECKKTNILKNILSNIENKKIYDDLYNFFLNDMKTIKEYYKIIKLYNNYYIFFNLIEFEYNDYLINYDSYLYYFGLYEVEIILDERNLFYELYILIDKIIYDITILDYELNNTYCGFKSVLPFNISEYLDT